VGSIKGTLGQMIFPLALDVEMVNFHPPQPLN